MLISRSGGARPIVGDACRREEITKLLVYHVQLLVETGFSEQMGDVGDPRLATAEERITEFIAEKIAEGDLRTQPGVSSGAGNPIQTEEEGVHWYPVFAERK